MARKVIAYGCEFRCGQKVVMNKSLMLDHETRCFYNPATKSCATCRFKVEEDHDEGGTYWYCDIEKCPEGKFATTECLYWESKES